jgi:putative NADPH-quinone reductase
MSKRIVLIQGHPDASAPHFCHALADAYDQGATEVGHAVRRVEVAHLDFPLLRSQAEWQDGALPASLAEAQQSIAWAEHALLIFPLWLGDMPALLKGFLEQVMRPGFAFDEQASNPFAKALKGRSARVVVTMGMPAALYRFYFRAHSLKSLERNILGFVGIAPIDETLIGGIESMDDKARGRWLAKLRALGAQGE